ncbi:TraB/GumN family protein [Rhodobacter calidifons]|uniref:TraB/GumN family protein n=1 Tax=Rhodobacter calidifons TaxID=2715277 RepID=A0ABX0G707_9RHOB|nr:TraB/GumN family protein [Rhodobacter calidifons]NHB76531.1 TraB/GumN family protein [Rhodobacter calidifons]
MPRLAAAALAFALGVLTALPAAAMCGGRNLFEEMDPAMRSSIAAAADAVPFPRGNFWQAVRGDEVITIAGTYHFDDPRHQANLDRLQLFIGDASTVLVESGPEEEKALMDLVARDPSRMFITTGPTLFEQLPADVWNKLSDAMSQRGIPGFMAAKFRPWYVLAVLAIPPCAMAQMTDPKGLDGMVIDAALAAGKPVRALEPFDTIFRMFDSMSEEEILAMLQSSLALEDRSEDHAVTLADSYFAGHSREIWEFMRHISYDLPGYTREQVDAEFARMEELLMNARNRAWIPVLTGAAAEGPVVAAFGALHLSGEEGVLNLLKQEGFRLTELKW